MAALLILLVVFGVIGFVTYRDHQARRQELPPGATFPALPDPVPEQEAAPATLLLELPEPARRRAWALLCLVHDGLSEGSSADTRTRYLLAQTRQSYLPDTVRAYLHLTEGARRQLTALGQSPEQLLDEQLTLMENGVHEALRRDHAAADRLLTQGRFLRERFGAGTEEWRVRG